MNPKSQETTELVEWDVCLPGNTLADGAAASQKKGSPMLAHQGWYLVQQTSWWGTHTLTHACMALHKGQWANAQTYTLRHMHALPHSNHSVHAPCTSPETHSHTCMNRLTAITVTQAQTHTPTHACIASQQHMSCAAIAVSIRLIYIAKMKWAYALFMHASSDTYTHCLAKWSQYMPYSCTHTRTFMHHLAVMTASISLDHAHTHTYMHCLIAMTSEHVQISSLPQQKPGEFKMFRLRQVNRQAVHASQR